MTIVVAAVATIIWTWCARELAVRIGFVSRPNPLVPQHTRCVAYLGGVAVAAGVVTAIHRTIPARLWIPAMMFLAIGLADDLCPLTPARKLWLQGVPATVAIALGFSVEVTGNVLADGVITWLWIILLVNAVNVTDVCDGLVAGVSVPVFLALPLFSAMHGELPLAIAGACAGFLVFNRPPATIFLGDAGSHVLGFFLAVLTPVSVKSIPLSLLMTGLFLFEVALLVSARIMKGIPWWRGSRDHFSLRLQNAGFSTAQTDLLAVTTAVMLATMALIGRSASPLFQMLLLAAACGLFLAAARVLLKWETGPGLPAVPSAQPVPESVRDASEP